MLTVMSNADCFLNTKDRQLHGFDFYTTDVHLLSGFYNFSPFSRLDEIQSSLKTGHVENELRWRLSVKSIDENIGHRESKGVNESIITAPSHLTEDNDRATPRGVGFIPAHPLRFHICPTLYPHFHLQKRRKTNSHSTNR